MRAPALDRQIVGRTARRAKTGDARSTGSADPQIEHLLRRAGFGARPDELDTYTQLSFTQAVETLLDYESVPDVVDSNIGQPGYVNITTTGVFSPQSNIN